MELSTKSAGKTVALMIFATLLSKLLGMVRGMLIASRFADSVAGVAFTAASQIPLSLFDIFFAAAVLGAFLPIYRGTLTENCERAARFSSAFFTVVTAATALFAVLGVIFARPLLSLAAPELTPEAAKLAIPLLRLMFPAMLFAGMAYTLVGILQSHESFFLPALVSSFSNAVMILYLLFCKTTSQEFAVRGLAVAFLLSWMAQYLTLAVPLIKKHLLPRLTAALRSKDLRLAAHRALPVMAGSWLLPAGTLIATYFSSLISGSALVAYSYAFTVYAMLAGVLSYGVCNFLFPKLSAQAATGDKEAFCTSLRDGLFASFAMILPVAAATFVLANEGINVLYLRGDFSPALASQTADALRVLAPVMPAFCLTELLSRAAYAGGYTRLPMAATFVGIAVNLGTAALFAALHMLTVSTVACAAALGQAIAALMLLILILVKNPTILHEKNHKAVVALIISGLFCTGFMVFIHRMIVKSASFSGLAGNFLTILLVFIPSLVLYLLCITVSGVISMPRKKGGDIA